jgi:hypothetical protein
VLELGVGTLTGPDDAGVVLAEVVPVDPVVIAGRPDSPPEELADEEAALAAGVAASISTTVAIAKCLMRMGGI